MCAFFDLGKSEMDLCCNVKYFRAATRPLVSRVKLNGLYPSPIKGELTVEERRDDIGNSGMLI